MQDITTGNRVLGRASAGEIQEVQVATDMIADDAVTADKLANTAVTAVACGAVSATGASSVFSPWGKSTEVTPVADSALPLPSKLLHTVNRINTGIRYSLVGWEHGE